MFQGMTIRSKMHDRAGASSAPQPRKAKGARGGGQFDFKPAPAPVAGGGLSLAGSAVMTAEAETESEAMTEAEAREMHAQALDGWKARYLAGEIDDAEHEQARRTIDEALTAYLLYSGIAGRQSPD